MAKVPDELEKSPFALTLAEVAELDALMDKDSQSKLTAAEEKRVQELLGGYGAGGTAVWDKLFGVLSGATVTVSVAGIADKPVFKALAELTTAPSAQTVTELTKLSDGDVKVTVEGKTAGEMARKTGTFQGFQRPARHRAR